jgi:hypothetical protein
MNTRGQGSANELGFQLRRACEYSEYLLSRPADGPVDGANNLIMSLGTSRPYEIHGMSLVDAESRLLNRGTVVGKWGHAASSFDAATLRAAGDNVPVPASSVPRLDFFARDTKSAALPLPPPMPVNDVRPVPTAVQVAGVSARQAIRDVYA